MYLFYFLMSLLVASFFIQVGLILFQDHKRCKRKESLQAFIEETQEKEGENCPKDSFELMKELQTCVNLDVIRSTNLFVDISQCFQIFLIGFGIHWLTQHVSIEIAAGYTFITLLAIILVSKMKKTLTHNVLHQYETV